MSEGKWIDGSCRVYDGINGQLRPHKDFGIRCVESDPCPDPTPPPPPVETPTPTPPPAPECADGPNGITTDFFWASQTSKNPVLYLRDAKQNGFWSASFYCDRPGDKIHKEDPRYPGGIPTFWDGHREGQDESGWYVENHDGHRIVTRKSHRGEALGEAVRLGAQTSWLRQRTLVDCGDGSCNIDCTWSTSNGHNIGCQDHDFRAKNTFAVKVWVNGRWLYGGCPDHINADDCREGILEVR